MSIETLYDSDACKGVMFCNTTGWAFGPVIHDESASDVPDDCEMLDARSISDVFQQWLGKDARKADRDNELEEAYGIFLAARRDGMYPKLSGEGCAICGNDIGHHTHCPLKT